MKLFFRELKPMLISHDIIDKYSNAKSFKIFNLGAERVETLIEYLGGLDLSIRMVLYLMIKHLEVINAQKDVNLMDFYNLSVVFGPTLIESDAIEMLKAVEILKTVLDNAANLFKSEKYMAGILENIERVKAQSGDDSPGGIGGN